MPLGFVLGLGPAASFVAAAAGVLLGCWSLLLAGDQVAARVQRRQRRDTGAEAAIDDGVGGAPGSGIAGDGGRQRCGTGSEAYLSSNVVANVMPPGVSSIVQWAYFRSDGFGNAWDQFGVVR